MKKFTKAETILMINEIAFAAHNKVKEGRKMNYKVDSYQEQGYYIPERMLPGLIRWIEDGVLPGDFLTAVLENKLSEALGKADQENRDNIFAYVLYLYNVTPFDCWGSVEKVKAWRGLNKGGKGVEVGKSYLFKGGRIQRIVLDIDRENGRLTFEMGESSHTVSLSEFEGYAEGEAVVNNSKG